VRVGVEVQFLSITVLVLAAFVLGSKDNKEIVHPGTAVLVPRGTLHSFESLDENSKLDLPASTGPGSQLVYAASWFMGNPSPGTMNSGAGAL
jgi:hypothetical protein